MEQLHQKIDNLLSFEQLSEVELREIDAIREEVARGEYLTLE